MTSGVAAPLAEAGRQEPEFCHVPPYIASAGEEAIELAELAGLELDPWQKFILINSLGERADGSWAAFEIGINVPRQNGKGSILEAIELAALFLLEENLVIHSAHEFATSLEAFARLLFLIENTPDLDRRVARVSNAHGKEGIELKGRRRIRFRTRTKGGGRGFTGDRLIFDEAMFLPETALGALIPTLAARPNPQVLYVGSAVDQEIHDHGSAFTRIRARGLKGEDPRLAYFEHSIGIDLADVTDEIADDPEMWARANPALGRRISAEYVGQERKTLDLRTFAVERLGAGDWPELDQDADQELTLEAWMICTDGGSAAEDPVCFAFDVKPDRSAGAIGVAGRRSDGWQHVEIVEHKAGTGWMPERLAELVKKHDTVSVICDERSPAAALLPRLKELNIEVRVLNGAEYAQACGAFLDAVNDVAVRHRGTPELRAAVRGARTRPLGDAWAWSRKSSSVDISPLVAVTIALWGLVSGDGPSIYETRGVLPL